MFAASAGATVCVNLSASNFTIGKAEIRRMLAASASDRGKCAYLYVAAGPGESSTDLAFDADGFIYENGTELAATERPHPQAAPPERTSRWILAALAVSGAVSLAALIVAALALW